MKTIDDAKFDYVANANLTIDIIEQNMNAFDAGFEFAQRWIPVEEEFPEQLMPLANRFKSENVLVKRKWDDTGEIAIEINCRFRPSPRIGFLWNIEYKGSSIIEWRPIERM
jgi:hypothetical protein